MMPLQPLYDQIHFMFTSLNFLGKIDLLLVTGAFYLLLTLIRRSAAAYMLREVLIFGVALFILTSILPLPVFDWLVRGVLVGLLIATPIIFQAQLRHFIERTGRGIGLAQVLRDGFAEQVLSELLHAIESMAESKTGALIVLEGNDALEEFINTGIPSGGQITTELLQSIFYSGTPLHDGAMIIQGDKIAAAGCILPLTQQALQADKRLGTRHRAAVGLSETTDAMVIIVSEETGFISVARHGSLYRPLTGLELREKLLDFYTPLSAAPPNLYLGRLLLHQLKEQLWPTSWQPRELFINLGLILLSFMLTLVVWSFVIQQTNAIRKERIENIPLRIENLPPDVKIISPLITTISVIIQATESVMPTLSPRSFQAVVTLENPAPGVYRLPVKVKASADQILVLLADPAEIDLELAQIISQTMPVTVDLPDQRSLSAAYELVGNPIAKPDQVQVIGPAPSVEQVRQIQTSLFLANASTNLHELVTLHALDAQGKEVLDVILQPTRIQVTANIQRRRNALNVSIRPKIVGPPPAGYWLSNLSVTPAGLTLQGDPDKLTDIKSFVDTLPVDVRQAVGDLTVQTPLDLPVGVQAVDENGKPLHIVTVVAQVTPRRGDLAGTRTIQLLKAMPGYTVTISPRKVDLLLSGPLPILQAIEVNPALVQVLIDASIIPIGQSADIIPTVIAPDNIEWKLVPPSVEVKVEGRQ